MVQSEPKSRCRQLPYLMVLGVALTSAISTQVLAQDEGDSCPCFSAEEVKAVYLHAEQLAAGGGSSNCIAQDYSVEFSAEVIILDENFSNVARASVSWADYKASRCDYEDTTTDPADERNVTWPNPAPEGPARACFDIIAGVIAELDTSGTCITYP